MTELSPMPPTFDDLCVRDLERVYEQGKEEVLRDHAFRILLALTDTRPERWQGMFISRIEMKSECYVNFADSSSLFAVTGAGLTMDAEIHKL